jgi:fructosamine-3-kinase
MLPQAVHQSVVDFLNQRGPGPTEIISTRPLSGGSINEAFQLKTNKGVFFLKYNNASRHPEMFEKEGKGLSLLRSAGEIDVPEVLYHGEAGQDAFLLLKFIDPAGKFNDFWEDFGKCLAKLHSHHADRFGLDHDNYMGSLYQYNTFHDDWTEFFIEERLERQIKLARENAAIGRNDVSGFERLYKRLEEIFPKTRPSLIHGDLWSGNFMVNGKGRACLIDPAVYYGHPEIDIAMSVLFGGFNSSFYEAYIEHNPLEKGWKNRLDIYNLYPLMVHVNLFGGGYLGSVQKIIGRF